MILITQVGQVVSRLTIVDRDTHKDNISVSFSRVHARIGDVIIIESKCNWPSCPHILFASYWFSIPHQTQCIYSFTMQHPSDMAYLNMPPYHHIIPE